MEGKDVIGIAETGSGKTAAFLLPLIQKTLTTKKPSHAYPYSNSRIGPSG